MECEWNGNGMENGMEMELKWNKHGMDMEWNATEWNEVEWI